MKKNWEYVLTNNQLKLLILLFIGMVLLSFFEILGLASITTFVAILINNEITLFGILPESINKFISNLETEKKIIYGSFFLFILFLLKSIIQLLYNYFEVYIYRNITVKNSENFFLSTIYSPYKLHINKSSTVLIRKIQQDIAAVTAYFKNIINILKEFIILTSIFLLLFFTDPLISSLCFIILGFFSITFYFFIKKKITRLTKETQISKAKIIDYINQSVFSFKENIILRIRKILFKNYTSELYKIENFNLYTSFILRVPRIFLELIGISGILLVTYFFILFDKNVNEIIPLLTLLVTSIIRMIPSFNTITSSVGTLKINKIRYNEICNDLRKESKNIEKANLEELVDYKNIFEDEIILENLSFKFNNEERHILQNIYLNFKKGQSVGIIGETGSGKSTLIDILLGILKPTNGKYLIDGKNFDYDRSKNWHSKIGYIPQELYLINDSIKKNIAFGIDDNLIDKEKLNEVIYLSRLKDFVEKLPNGIDTKVGERGIKISGGEKQRIAIARALYNNPEIIIMDEATSSLDVSTEKEFMKSIENLKNNSTLIIVAHRLSTIKKCNFIIHLSEGKIIDEGSFSELKSRNSDLISQIS